MAQHGIRLAGQHLLNTLSTADLLLPRLANNEATLASAYEILTRSSLEKRRITPAAEWLLDNYYLIAEQIRIARNHLPKGYSRELPRLANGSSSGLPRVYGIALEIISHGDGRVDNDNLGRFITAYQSVTPLTLGELWAVPIMLRLALIENLRRVASRVMTDLDDRNLAEHWADRMTETAGRDPKSVVLAVADMARSDPPMTSSFVAELARRLQGQSAALALPLTWIEQLLSESALGIDRMVQIEAQQQAADQVSISNSIGSLRLLSATDWRDFVESMSIVEQVLRDDPAGIYREMDFATRDHYRHTVERLARDSAEPEEAVARSAIELARAGSGVERHVGFYLMRRGLVQLEQRVRMRVTAMENCRRVLRHAPLETYLGLSALLTVLFAWPFLDTARHHDWHDWQLVLLAVPALLMTSRIAIDLVNWFVTLTVRPDWLPRLDYAEGIPAQARTMVVIPSLIGSTQDIDDLAEGLEVRFLANRDPHLHFGLLTDFLDAASEVLEQDAALTLRARESIEALNGKYPDAHGDRFFLFHRPRRWNAAEKLWMGHERKRGKLAELDALLRGSGRERFALVVGNIVALPRVRYVITLDTDTQLPRDAARQFVGTIAHPLNAAVYDSKRQCVTSGHAILQPRVGISLPSTARSTYAQLLGGDAGIDPYTRAVSDVYQDLFHEGSFIGKGIYEIDTFERSMEGRFADNSILSHDLIEGCYARAGLLSDVHLYEEYPARYSADVNRRHRWIRGDWQLLPWIFPWAPTQHGGIARNPLSVLSRWKLFDNLRRSLAPAAWLTMLLVGWFGGLPPIAWTLAVLALAFTLPLLATLIELLQKPHDMPLRRHFALSLQSSGRHLSRALLALAWLPHETLYSVDAIMRTLWRMGISRRRLLQWKPSREVELIATNDIGALYRLMWIGPLLALGLAAFLLPTPATLIPAAAFIALWMASPAIAWWISQPPARTSAALAADETRFLHALARRTWAFFDQYVGPDDHWLPPDNIQEQQGPVVAAIAHRTSPTNMGMALLAHLAAFDFGYLSAARMLTRMGATLETMDMLERHRNHFFNWYDTETLQTLSPRYVSTVDSGNLAGHLMTLRRGLIDLADERVFDARIFPGLADTLDVFRDAALAAGFDRADFEPMQTTLETESAVPLQTCSSALATMLRLLAAAAPLAKRIHGSADSDIAFWSRALMAQCHDIVDELSRFDLPPPTGADPGIPTWRQLAQLDAGLWPEPAQARVAKVRGLALERIATITRLAQLAGDLATMDFGFLYDRRRDLLAIGYNVDERRTDAGFYDLLASEARLTNFVAIAQGQLPQESWFTLGRLLTSTGGVPVLLSWTGSMFEYLMPMLVMPSYEGTLLDQTCRAAVARQIEYGHQLGLPWGISESGYNVLDGQFNYQYRAFGVPGLGLKRGLGEDIVVAPYASALALMVAPEAACRNLQRLTAAGAAGRYGMYEAIDHTQARVPRGQSSVVIRSFMAHHQGMSLLSLASVLLGQPMQRRFESDPQFKATTLLLQERIPKTATEYLPTPGLPDVDTAALVAETKLRIFTDPDRLRPSVQLLSNGHYHVMVSSAGGGYSRCGEFSVNRWREDITSDNWGMFCYLRDVASGEFWSSGHQPTLKHAELYEAIFSDARAEFRVRERDFDAHTEIVVSPEDDIELRRLHITNRARIRRTIELTSYTEVVLAPAVADAMHPAFSNLFVQTELVEPLQAILCTRRARSAKEAVPWMCHLLAAHGVDIDAISYETDRARFIGRGRSVEHPAVMEDGSATQGRLSNSAGSVLDPIVSIRCRITLDPGQRATIDFVTGISDSREGCLQLINKYRDRNLADRVFDLAWTHSQVSLRQMNATLSDARLYEQMAAAIIYANASLRAEPSVLSANRRNQSGLWGQSISGDLPIVLLQITDMANIELVRQMVQAHAYWRLKGLAVDLVIWNEDHAGYRQHLQDLIMGLIASGMEASLIERPGGIFVRPAQQLSREDRELMQAVARIIVVDTRGSLAEQVQRRRPEPAQVLFEPTRVPVAVDSKGRQAPRNELILRNPYGGFTADGTEYVMTLRPDEPTPAPWVNVLANPGFGTVVSESGGAYTWSENAHEFRLTPWANDPVGDTSGEALYLRDEETGHYWSPTPLPLRSKTPYVARHGFGYSVFEHREDGICSELWVYVALHAPIKFSVLKIRNESGRPRKLSATSYVEWALGDLREKSAMHVVTEADPHIGALFARNDYSMEFAGRVAFLDVDVGVEETVTSFTGDRGEFLGRNGSLRVPAAMRQARLSGRVGAGLDPCAALKADFDLPDGDTREIVFRLGAARDSEATTSLSRQFRGAGAAAEALDAVREYWRGTLGRVQVNTPEPAVDVLVNGWLMYQVIACRFWARSGYYQSGGAIGFRDQLQDCMSMIHATPHLAREHLLLCAAHQFPEGDVLHWWHPPLGRGVRTECSDDYLWLAVATSRYVRITGDLGVLDERIGYIEGRPVNQGEDSYYDLPVRSALVETLYEHCKRAIEHGLTRGAHGLPLIGCGDWNDGMNRVGEQGRGESVWLGFFLYDVLLKFAETARAHDDVAFARHCGSWAIELQGNLEAHGWDGEWYRRAYFDDGTPLGSAGNDECRIDSIAQSWSVLSGAGSDERQREAMASLDRYLVKRDAGLIQLLDPPFDKSALDPGYIKGYVPGVRENGGQYTHAAIWATMAFAALGDGERAWELLRMINPVNHGNSAASIERYKVEPYVMTADVYGVSPHAGRGGWSWYTGSAGWMYRLLVESLLGLQVEGDRLTVVPLLPADWDSFELRYCHGSAVYRLGITRSTDNSSQIMVLDGVPHPSGEVLLVDDGREHTVHIWLPSDATVVSLTGV
ncbi:glucoamylase family protein [Caballeronia sp. dw_19]|uniref:GH36-type glycosyl hydrolase domain-containing protein n=1 Tax=Caballeronia sp. dw_19 TaxID=2719791 RepID=UPI001BD6AF08|nr:glucoamylase family protein [Caballeronia sp. dw_19]